MKSFGKGLASTLRGGSVVELIGDVGAGKTTLTKGIAQGLGVDEPLQSPSFTLSRVYDIPGGRRLAHYDFYRLQDPGILADELADTAQQTDIITVIEWGDIVEGVLPAARTVITIETTSETERTVEVKEL